MFPSSSIAFPTSGYVYSPSTPPSTPPRHATRRQHHSSAGNPRFSRLFGTVLGSPFLTTSDLADLPADLDMIDGALSVVPRHFTITRPSSPAPTTDFSIINIPLDVDIFGSPVKRRSYSPGTADRSMRSLLPRIWDALASPGRTVLSTSSSNKFNIISASKSSPPTFSRSTSNSLVLGSARKGKAKATGYQEEPTSGINYEDLLPLDGEEGELIDDEACFIDIKAVTGIDILSLLPAEVSLHILCTFLDLPTILACLCVSHTWNELAADNAVWRAMFLKRASSGWHIDLAQARTWSGLRRVGHANGARKRASRLSHVFEEWNYRRASFGSGPVMMPPAGLGCAYTYPRMKKLPPLPPCEEDELSIGPSVHSRYSRLPSPAQAPLTLDWKVLYRQRLELDKRWIGQTTGLEVSVDRDSLGEAWEPKVMRIAGHNDSVYCLEFDATRIITGSRDRTIKVWSLKSGRLLGTFRGHMGSVLCLKFDKDWEQEDEDEDEDEDGAVVRGNDTEEHSAGMIGKRGFMVSGSSDCSVCVWDLYSIPSVGKDYSEEDGEEGEREVQSEVKAVLKGHSGGVLDLRIDKQWIVSCSKDAVIRVWDRSTLAIHRTLRGHEGPVNAVGLQSGKVVSASGDGKMILWDIESGERLRTFEGHDRGLACIEFKDDYIVSGSNDCKIKIWSASTGECLRTLVGHEALVRALSFDPLNGRLVSASYDKTVKLWDLWTGKLIREFRSSHTSHIFDVKFDVARIVSTSHDQRIVVLDFSHGLDASLFI